MKKENAIQLKSYAFSIRIVKLYQFIRENHSETVLCKQLLRSGTSIGANIEESLGAITDKDFYYKISISYKEARETKYWIRLLSDTGYIPEQLSASFIKDIEEIITIISSIQITMKKKIKEK
jgi:four helix bundle protein